MTLPLAAVTSSMTMMPLVFSEIARTLPSAKAKLRTPEWKEYQPPWLAALLLQLRMQVLGLPNPRCEPSKPVAKSVPHPDHTSPFSVSAQACPSTPPNELNPPGAPG